MDDTQSRRAWLDEAGRVAGEVPCEGCGYNLHMAGGEGNCPECGLAVAATLKGTRLFLRDPKWIDKIAVGAKFLAVGGMCLMVTVVTAFCSAIGLPGDDYAVFSLAVLSLWIGSGLGIVGLFMLTSAPLSEKGKRLRLRHGPGWMVAGALGSLVVTFVIDRWSYAYFIFVDLCTMALAGVYGAALLYGGDLARKVGRRGLAGAMWSLAALWMLFWALMIFFDWEYLLMILLIAALSVPAW